MYRPIVTLQVRLREAWAKDRLGNDIPKWSDPIEVPGCLWASGTPENLSDDARPEGVSISATAHFPKGFTGDLRGALVACDDVWLAVIGEPYSHPEAARRGPWSTYVLLGRTDG